MGNKTILITINEHYSLGLKLVVRGEDYMDINDAILTAIGVWKRQLMEEAAVEAIYPEEEELHTIEVSNCQLYENYDQKEA